MEEVLGSGTREPLGSGVRDPLWSELIKGLCGGAEVAGYLSCCTLPCVFSCGEVANGALTRESVFSFTSAPVGGAQAVSPVAIFT